jgi:hypothetical protein
LGGLRGYLANVTSLAEHQFIYTKLPNTGWNGGADTDSEGTYILSVYSENELLGVQRIIKK